ncbi:beta-carotene isomerase D27, chloroplastic [Impatiens glandulifera]|uniref:beta-carotene isomerase D27, chloroplastic n=1 Tax=Impatiens glandulifera TaxID=253017 RepID=UPI001FB0DD09|nr:beta-carotene isomerase D27, chloroplastic [Impatiens glandulifera]
MEAQLIHGQGSHFLSRKIKKTRIPVLCVLAKPNEGEIAMARTCNSKINNHGRIVYKDNFLERFAINHLSLSVQSATGFKVNKEGYEGLVEAAKTTSVNFNPTQQHDLVLDALDKAIPKFVTLMIRTVLRDTKFSRELFSAITAVCFTWLIGHCEVRESEMNNGKEKNVVHIKKCRFLEESNCVGMCTNLCKMPSQTFIKDSFGLSVNMVPNFDDMSCQMIFGQEPPSRIDDPAFKEPCFALCKTKQKHRITTCPASNLSN